VSVVDKNEAWVKQYTESTRNLERRMKKKREENDYF